MPNGKFANTIRLALEKAEAEGVESLTDKEFAAALSATQAEYLKDAMCGALRETFGTKDATPTQRIVQTAKAGFPWAAVGAVLGWLAQFLGGR